MGKCSHILWPFGIYFPALVCCTKNLATLNDVTYQADEKDEFVKKIAQNVAKPFFSSKLTYNFNRGKYIAAQKIRKKSTNTYIGENSHNPVTLQPTSIFVMHLFSLGCNLGLGSAEK
jgi:hypothetical protein